MSKLEKIIIFQRFNYFWAITNTNCNTVLKKGK